MTAFASSADLAIRLGVTLTSGELARADALLGDVAGLIQDEAKQTIFLVTGDILRMKGTRDERIKLPERPVVSVTSVALDGALLTAGAEYVVDGNELVRLPSSIFPSQVFDASAAFSFGTGFGWEKQDLVITYTHGYADGDVPGLCKSISLEAVTRCFVNPGAVARESIGDTSTVYDNNRFAPTGLLLNDDERRAIRRFFGRRGRSIQVGG